MSSFLNLMRDEVDFGLEAVEWEEIREESWLVKERVVDEEISLPLLRL